MRWFRATLIGFLFTLMVSPQTAMACPFCEAGVNAANTTEELAPETDPLREPRPYHLSVYLMVGMPYVLLATVGFLVFRAFKQKELADLAAVGQTQAATEVQQPCPDLSHGDRL